MNRILNLQRLDYSKAIEDQVKSCTSSGAGCC